LVVNAALFGAHYFCLLMLINVCSVQVLSDMEVEFARFIQFLSSMINKVTLRGTFPHCMFCINVSHSSLFSLLSETINIVSVFFHFDYFYSGIVSYLLVVILLFIILILYFSAE